MFKLLGKATLRNEEKDQEVIASLLKTEHNHIVAARQYEEERNHLFISQGIPAPYAPLCKPCLNIGSNNLVALAELIAYKPGGVEKTQRILHDNEARDLIERLEQIEHTYRTEEKEGEPLDARRLGPLQRVRAHCLLDELENKEIVYEIAEIIERNPRDGKTELGGFIAPHYAKMRGTFYEFPSSTKDERSYAWSIKDIKSIPHIALFHLHALEDDCTRYAGPSQSESEESDMSSNHCSANHIGEAHDVVITKLQGKKFNVDYYTSQRRMHKGKKISEIGCLDLSNYEYN